MPSTIPTRSHPPIELLADISPDRTLPPHGNADVERIVAALTCNNPSAVTYEQIEAAMTAVGHDPSEATDLYQVVIGTLEQRAILVVEMLADDQQWEDEDAAAEDVANEVWSMLKKACIPLDECRHPLLAPDRERRLLEIYQDGRHAQAELDGELSRIQRQSAWRRVEASNQALDELMRCNLRLVSKIAARYARFAHHLSFDDLIQEGRIGLYKAIERFNLHLHLRLSTYATWWIRQSIERAVGDYDRMIRLPIHLQEKLRHLKREQERWIVRTGSDPTNEELASVMGVSIQQVRHLQTVGDRTMSLDMPYGATGEFTLSDVLPHLGSDVPATWAEHQALQVLLYDLLDILTERERQVILLRFGLFDGNTQTFEMIGRQMGVTRERIRQIEGKALKKLQHPRVKKLLEDFLE